MKKNNLSLIVLLAAIILIVVAIPLKSDAAGTVSLPRTGQTASYAAGDDGAQQMGVAWPAPRFTVSVDCVTDNLTGLIWARNANLNGAPQTWDSAVDLAKVQTLCGRSDWRLPNVNELESLISASASIPATWLAGQGFTGAQPNPYWASTTYVNQTDMAWTVCLCDGQTGLGPKGNSTQVYALPVAGTTSLPAMVWKTGQTAVYRAGDDGDRQDGVAWPSPRFTANTDTSITDNLTGLIWAPDANVMNTRDPNWDDYGTKEGKVIWQRAFDYVTKLNNESYLGHSDWRLPNRKEGFSLMDRTRYNPSLPTGHPFYNVQPGSYWTSTTLAYDTGYATSFGTYIGGIGKAVKISGDSYTWPIRGGGADTPSVSTSAVSAITNTSAACGGTVAADGGAAVTARGVCWGTSANPTVSDSKTTDGSVTGAFTSSVTGLSPYTLYHVRAYATNSAGTGYGSDVPFNTPCPTQAAQIGTTPYDTLQEAVNSVSGTAEIRAVAGEWQELLNFSGNRTITLSGGYDCVCGAVIGVTTVHGSLTVGGGAVVTMSNVAVY